jgi:lysophospholipase L1-like esterase
VAVPKPPGVVRVLVVGDSVTFGFGVPLENTYLKVLESKLNAVAAGATRYEVLNAGMEGTGLDRYYDFLESSAPALQPDLVLVALTMNDIADYHQRGRVEDERSYSSASPLRRVNTFLLFHSQAYLGGYLRLKTLLYQWGILDFNEEHWYEIDILRPPTEEIRQAWKASRELLLNISKLTRARQWPLVLVMFPMEVQLNQEAVDHYRRELRLDVSSDALSGEPQHELLRFGGDADVLVADLLPAFRAANQPDLYLRGKSMLSDPVHPSITGHRVAGEALFTFLEKQPSLALALAPRRTSPAQ